MSAGAEDLPPPTLPQLLRCLSDAARSGRISVEEKGAPCHFREDHDMNKLTSDRENEGQANSSPRGQETT